MRLTIPTWLTLFRIALIPVLVLVWFLPFNWTNFAAALVFTLGALTDWADGWIARRYGMYSAFGAFLDPVADKLAVAVALLLIVQRHPDWFMVLMAAVIIGREITISALRDWMAALGERARVKVAWVGKVKTIVQMVAIVVLLYGSPIMGLPTIVFGEVLLGAAAILTLWSGWNYLHAAWPAMRREDGEDGQ